MAANGTGPVIGMTMGAKTPQEQNSNERQLLDSSEAFMSYPRNLIRTLVFEHTLESYGHKLQDESRRLFNPFPRTKLLRLRETDENNNGFRDHRPLDLASLKEHCHKRDLQDPACRYVFIQSKNARALLELTHGEFAYVLSYHQVMPPFLDLVFTCGRQEKVRDFHFTAFRHENYLGNEDLNSGRSFRLERLGRSGRQIQHCYNLHSVERSQSIPELGWSIRQTVVYHSFDIETGKSFWILIKGNDAIEKRITKATESARSPDMRASSHQTLTGSFGASLTTHVQIMEWCGEQWRWYINDVEDRLRKKSQNTLLADVDYLAGPASVPPPSRPGTLMASNTFRTTTTRGHQSSPRTLGSIRRFSITSKLGRTPTIPESSVAYPVHPEGIVEEPEQLDGAATYDEGDGNLEEMFSFQKLQDLHQTGEYMQEALMVLEQNCKIIKEIREHYTDLMENDQFPAEIRDGYKQEFSRFNQRAQSIEKDLEVQHSRLKTLNVMLEDKSNLFYTVQQYASMQASKHFARNAQATTDFTLKMTEKMHDIAVKTGHQTVSMHVITIFTLIFLPGTFLAVSLLRRILADMALITRQTFFSSGILRWYDSDEELDSSKYSWTTEQDRLVLYLEIAVPMMVLVIVGWLILYLKAKRDEERENYRMLEDIEKGFRESQVGEHYELQPATITTNPLGINPSTGRHPL
ncbi:hypothetical protein M426DRAFT_323190 [Hypoxylon sp. CI-4A]|nr:hypothetical protein M426DRAFT_323190 [Hypoxylon sp. CI-4A]